MLEIDLIRDFFGWIRRLKKPKADAAVTVRVEPIRPAVTPQSRKRKLTWSGRDHGPMPISRLTPAQHMVLSSAAYGDSLIGEADSVSREAFEDSRQAYRENTRTLKALAKHGFLKQDGMYYTITDKGLQALQVLRY